MQKKRVKTNLIEDWCEGRRERERVRNRATQKKRTKRERERNAIGREKERQRKRVCERGTNNLRAIANRIHSL